MKQFFQRTVLAAASLFAAGAQAGPFILAGTDADDHGFASATANFDGWLFMQRALENLAVGVTNGNKTVYTLGSSSSALTAANSAFGKSLLVGAGWNVVNLDGAAAINTFFGAGGGSGSAGIIMLDSGFNVTGGLDSLEEAALTANAGAINTFVGGGGGLFSQSNGYGWLSALVPSLTVSSASDQGLALTAAGMAAFPGLSNPDLSSGPYHSSFLGVGAIPVLATGINSFSSLNVIIGASGGGSIITPMPAIPEPSTYALMLAGLGMVGFLARRRKAAA